MKGDLLDGWVGLTYTFAAGIVVGRASVEGWAGLGYGLFIAWLLLGVWIAAAAALRR